MIHTFIRLRASQLLWFLKGHKTQQHWTEHKKTQKHNYILDKKTKNTTINHNLQQNRPHGDISDNSIIEFL